MRYTDFKSAIHTELRHNLNGLTWVELKERLDLPYNQPCPTWVRRLEQEIGLSRVKGSGRALVWIVRPEQQTGKVPGN